MESTVKLRGEKKNKYYYWLLCSWLIYRSLIKINMREKNWQAGWVAGTAEVRKKPAAVNVQRINYYPIYLILFLSHLYF